MGLKIAQVDIGSMSTQGDVSLLSTRVDIRFILNWATVFVPGKCTVFLSSLSAINALSLF